MSGPPPVAFVVFLVGFFLFVSGIALIYVPAALIVGGFVIALIAIGVDWQRSPVSKDKR